ncbi:hypothetical protein [Pseudophaeobacter sp.]|uniref:hypothetical protein n=1 Tax=Pseudophaeobacter sp. TaxID=1971739 RepID=UPI002619963A|nr:hypothetical protein [Pseudophaeobacter sp.]
MNFNEAIFLIKEIPVGTLIPKPKSGQAEIARWGIRRRSPALIYQIPNHQIPTNPHKKGVTIEEFRKAFEQLMQSGEFKRSWFEDHLPACRKEGSCNFTTIGGIFSLIGLSEYAGPGRYRALA